MGFLYVVERHRPSVNSDKDITYPVRVYKTREAAEEYADKLDQEWLETRKGTYHVVIGIEYFDE